MIKTIDDILKISMERPSKTISVVCAEDEDVMLAVSEAQKKSIINAILVGDKERIIETAKRIEIDITNFEILDCKDYYEAIRKGVAIIREGKADILMKGKVQTPDLMKAVLNKEEGLRTGEVLSHLTVSESCNYHKLMIVSDGGINIKPDMNQKVSIIKNSICMAKSLGIDIPKVAILSAIELVNQDIPGSIDAAIISKMAERGQIKDCIVDGPLAIDISISKKSAEIKGIKSEVCGDADIFIVPDIVSGNIMVKSLIYLAKCKTACVVLGAKKPIVLTSRADKFETKLNSIALATLL